MIPFKFCGISHNNSVFVAKDRFKTFPGHSLFPSCILLGPSRQCVPKNLRLPILIPLTLRSLYLPFQHSIPALASSIFGLTLRYAYRWGIARIPVLWGSLLETATMRPMEPPPMVPFLICPSSGFPGLI